MNSIQFSRLCTACLQDDERVEVLREDLNAITEAWMDLNDKCVDLKAEVEELQQAQRLAGGGA